MRTPLPASTLALLLVAATSSARADLTYPDLSGTAGLNLVGSAQPVGSEVWLTQGLTNQVGALWGAARQDVVSPWTCEVTVRMSGGRSGLALVLQRSGATALGSGGDNLGYGGLANSIAVELDPYADLALADPSPNHTSVHSNGPAPNSANEAASLGSSSVLPDLDDDAEHLLRVEYVPGILRVYVDDLSYPSLTLALDLDALLDLDDGTAWVGVTASSETQTPQTARVTSLLFDEQSSVWSGNHMPAQPGISEPATNGLVLNPYDVHMEAGPFVDVDGDAHASSDWEIYTLANHQRVWTGHGVQGPEQVHIHLGDGVFVGSHAGQAELWPQTAYLLRARFVDDSGDPLTEAGPWVERTFLTGTLNQTYPLPLDDLVMDPMPTWASAAGGARVILPAGPGAPALHLEGPTGQSFLTVRGLDGLVNEWVDFPELPQHEPLRLRIAGGSTGLVVAASDLTVVDHDCLRHRVLLPALNVPAGQTKYLWVSNDGATWTGQASDPAPVFTNQERGLALPWFVQQAGYQVDVVTEGLQLPVHLAFVPDPGDQPGDPFLYVTELYGKIRVLTVDGTLGTYASGLLNFSPTGNFPGSGEQGVSGIVVHPATGDVYAAMLYDGGPAHYPKVVRFTSNDGGLTAATQTTIKAMPGESQGQSHFISNLELLPDDTLLVHMGDGFNWTTAQNLNSYRGKILRMNLDGSAYSGNPLYDASNGIDARDYIHAYGVRNPFGGEYRHADGHLYTVENGPSVDRFAKVSAGQNFGWNDTNSSMSIGALHTWVPATGPVDLEFIEPEVFGGSGFPDDKLGHAFVSLSGPTYAPGPQALGKRIEEFVLDAAGNLVSGPTTLLEYTGTGRSTISGLAAGPDGLYFADLYRETGNNPTASGARILRVSYVGGEVDCGTPGTVYCTPAASNSTGQPAVIEAHGSASLAANDLELHAHDLPPNQFGYFLASLSPANVPNPGGSQGTLCLGGQIGRYNLQVMSSGPLGEIDVAVDVTAMPAPLAPAIQPGQTYFFQAWYRDLNPGSTSNFSPGLEVTFQ